MKALTEDVTDRYKQIVGLTTPGNPALTPDALEPIIAAAGGQHENEVSALSSRVAEQSKLTVAQAKPVVEAALEGKADPKAKADAVSGAVAGTTGASADVELSDPVMLAPWVRVTFAALLLVSLLLCVACITALGDASGTSGSALVSLAVIGVLALIGLLVLVMGYKNVTIKGAGPGASGKA